MNENLETMETVDTQQEMEYVRVWRTATRVYDQNARAWVPNPDYHPEIRQGVDEKFYTANGERMALKDVPEEIQKQAKSRKPNKINVAAFPDKRDRSMAEAMVDAGVMRPKRVIRTDETA